MKAINNICISAILALAAFELQASDFKSGVVGYEPNSIVLTDRDDSDLQSSYRVNLSFKYEFSRFLWFEPKRDRSLHFTYNGEFDFYWGFRESSPVVGRVFNPALHYRIPDKKDKHPWDYLEISLHHRSNGQQTDAGRSTARGFTAALQLAAGNNAYIDGISRSSDYLQVETKFKPADDRLLYLRAKFYDGDQENTVTWRGQPFEADFEDYERIEAIYSHRINDSMRLSANWSIGDKGFATDSLDIGLQWNYGLPWYFKAHFGPMETLSDHTRSVNSVGVGFIFWEI